MADEKSCSVCLNIVVAFSSCSEVIEVVVLVSTHTRICYGVPFCELTKRHLFQCDERQAFKSKNTCTTCCKESNSAPSNLLYNFISMETDAEKMKEESYAYSETAYLRMLLLPLREIFF